MTIGRIKALLEADVLYGEDTLDDEVNYCLLYTSGYKIVSNLE